MLGKELIVEDQHLGQLRVRFDFGLYIPAGTVSAYIGVFITKNNRSFFLPQLPTSETMAAFVNGRNVLLLTNLGQDFRVTVSDHRGYSMGWRSSDASRCTINQHRENYHQLSEQTALLQKPADFLCLP